MGSEVVQEELKGAKRIDFSIRSDKNGFSYVVWNQQRPEESEWHEKELRDILIILDGLLKEIEV